MSRGEKTKKPRLFEKKKTTFLCGEGITWLDFTRIKDLLVGCFWLDVNSFGSAKKVLSSPNVVVQPHHLCVNFFNGCLIWPDPSQVERWLKHLSPQGEFLWTLQGVPLFECSLLLNLLFEIFLPRRSVRVIVVMVVVVVEVKVVVVVEGVFLRFSEIFHIKEKSVQWGIFEVKRSFSYERKKC